MNTNVVGETVEKRVGKVGPGYLATVILLMGVFPVVSMFVERAFAESAAWWDLGFRCFVFWGVGIRLLLAGLLHARPHDLTGRCGAQCPVRIPSPSPRGGSTRPA
jgi:hypothetical protein